jgi:hypothetical protein
MTIDDLDAGHGARRGPGHVVHAIRMWKQRQLPDEAGLCLARSSQQRLIGDGRAVALVPVPSPLGCFEVVPVVGQQLEHTGESRDDADDLSRVVRKVEQASC